MKKAPLLLFAAAFLCAAALHAAPKPKSGGLHGLWLNTDMGYEMTLLLNPDGTGQLDGQGLKFKAKGGALTVFYEEGEAMVYAYSLQDDVLTLSGGDIDAPLAFRRGGAAAPKGPAPGLVPAAPPSAKGGVAPELVGKWCQVNVNSTNTGGSSSSACLLLNPDGTYDYSAERSMSVNTADFYGGTASQDSDRGRWWVQEDRLFYDSPARGQGSYRLEKVNHPKTNDPMIVLDGETYVTYYQKPPW